MFVIVNYLKKYLTYDVEYSDIQTEFPGFGINVLIQDDLEYTGAMIADILMHRGVKRCFPWFFSDFCVTVREACTFPPELDETPNLHRRKAFLRCGILPVLIYCLLFFPDTARILAAFACAVCADDILMRLSLFRKGAEL